MIWTADVLHKLMGEHHPGQGTPQHLADRMAKIESTEAACRTIARECDRLTECHRAALAELDRRLAGVQAECDHPATWRHPDPSGNNDSWTECLVCGKSI